MISISKSRILACRNRLVQKNKTYKSKQKKQNNQNKTKETKQNKAKETKHKKENIISDKELSSLGFLKSVLRESYCQNFMKALR